MENTQRIPSQPTETRRYLVSIVVALSLLFVSLMVYPLFTGANNAESYAPYADAAIKLKSEATLGHLWLEKSIRGDKHEAIAKAWQHLDKAAWYARAMLEGARESELIIAPSHDVELRKEIEYTLAEITDFRVVAEMMWATTNQSGISPDIAHRFEAQFERLLERADNLQITLYAATERAQRNFQILQGLLILLYILLTALVGTILLNYERRQAAVMTALRKSEERLELAMTVANDGMWDWDLQTNVVYCDARYFTIAGYEPNEFDVSLDAWEQRLHPDDRTATKTSLDAYLAGEKSQFDVEFRFRRKDGDWMWIRGRGIIVARDERGAPRRMIGTHADITEHKRTVAERERLILAIEHAVETIVITDVEGTIQYVNPAFEQITGYSREESIGQNPRMLKSEEHDEAFYAEIWETLSRGEVWSGRVVNKKKDDSLFTVDLTMSPVREESGKAVNYVAVQRDVTDEIKLEAQFHQAQKMEAVGQLAGGVAHDFNNLLQVILGYGEIALVDMEPESPVRASIEQVLKAAERARTLVQQLLSFSRRQVLEMRDIDLNESITDLMKMLERLIGEHITLEVLPGHNLGVVYADPSQITQILMNLCVNARDAMPTGGVIMIETENVRIDEAYCHAHTWATPGRYALLSVTDTGCGMDTDTRGQVFEPFFTTKGVGEGTGLGLATVYGLVKQHQGFIHVYSEVGKGTTIKIYLPLVERPATSVGDKIDGIVRGGSETILLAEDDAAVRKLSELFLESAGYTVRSACDGEEALQVFSEHGDEVDLALLDVVMPKLGGHAVFEQIRETRSELPVLFTSGYSVNAIHTNFLHGAGLQLIRKPCQRNDLLRRVREVLDSCDTAPE